MEPVKKSSSHDGKITPSESEKVDFSQQLPDEVILKIFEKLGSLKDVATLSEVSNKLNRIGQDDILWKSIAKVIFISDDLTGEKSLKEQVAERLLKIKEQFKDVEINSPLDVRKVLIENFHKVVDRDPKILNSKDLALEAVKYNYKNYEILSQDLKNDPDIALIAIQGDYKLARFFKDLKTNHQFFLDAAQVHYLTMKHMDESLGDDDEIILEGLKQKVLAMRYASKELKDNPDFILKAVKIQPGALRYASDRLRNDPDFIKKVIKVSPGSERYIGSVLKSNERFMSEIQR